MKDEATKPEIRTIKTGTCPTLSGKSTLTYNIGCEADSQVYLRVEANSAAGYFKPEWVSLAAIQKITEKATYITAFHLRSVFVGKSTNSPGFMLAVLKAEGLVKLKDEKERVYVAIDAGDFLAGIKTLMEAKPDAGEGASAAAIKKGKKATSKHADSPLET